MKTKLFALTLIVGLAQASQNEENFITVVSSDDPAEALFQVLESVNANEFVNEDYNIITTRLYLETVNCYQHKMTAPQADRYSCSARQIQGNLVHEPDFIFGTKAQTLFEVMKRNGLVEACENTTCLLPAGSIVAQRVLKEGQTTFTGYLSVLPKHVAPKN